MAIEIERKFLVSGDFLPEAVSSTRIVQGYICSQPGRTVRIRIRGEEGFLTIKGASDEKGLSRYEFEQKIPLVDAERLLELCEPGDDRQGSLSGSQRQPYVGSRCFPRSE